jgi:hypothetical protein
MSATGKCTAKGCNRPRKVDTHEELLFSPPVSCAVAIIGQEKRSMQITGSKKQRNIVARTFISSN